MAHDIFVSYSSKDKAIADTIVSSMEKNNIRCWYAPRDVKPSEDWGKAISNAIQQSKVFLVIFSGNANKSQRVLDELNFAISQEVSILPFRIENLEPDGAMRLHLSSRHWLDAYDPSWEGHIKKLIITVSSILESTIDEKKVKVPEKIKKETIIQKRLQIPRVLVGLVIGIIVIIAGWLVLSTMTGGDNLVKAKPTSISETAKVVTEGEATEGRKFKAALLTEVPDASIVVEKSYSDLGWDALLKAKEDLGIEIILIETTKLADIEPNLTKMASESYDFVVGVGFNFGDAMAVVAPKFPDTKFLIVDRIVDEPNVISLVFAVEEGSFLVGAIAAGMSETGKIGFIGGYDVPEIEMYEAGYIAGARSINPSIKVISGYLNNWFDVVLCKERALDQNRQGADVIYSVAGASSFGIIDAAEENCFWAIGADYDQDGLSPGIVLTSMVKHVDVALYDAVKAAYEGILGGGVKVSDLAADGVGYSELKYTRSQIPEDLLARVDYFAKMIAFGEITVPTKRDEANSFILP